MRNVWFVTLSLWMLVTTGCGKTGFAGSTPFGADSKRSKSSDATKSEGDAAKDSENGTKSEQYSDGDISDPVNIAGTYLTCGTALSESDGGPAMGCAVMSENDRPVNTRIELVSVVVTSQSGQAETVKSYPTYWSRYWHFVLKVSSFADVKSLAAKIRIGDMTVERTARALDHQPKPEQSKAWFKKRSKSAPVGTDWDRLEVLYIQKVLSGKSMSKSETSKDDWDWNGDWDHDEDHGEGER